MQENLTIAILEMLVQLQGQQNEDAQSKTNLEQEIQQEVEQSKQQKIEIIKKEEEIEALKKELSQVYNSKRWRYTEKISKIFH